MANTIQNFDKVRFWIQNYCQGDMDDKRNLENLIICEGDEILKPFRLQLHSIAQGLYDEELMDQLAGKKRKVKHGSYENWARLILLWAGEMKKGA